MSQYKVHRVRFVPYVPQAIHCLAVEGTSYPRLAVSRADNSIEIWNLYNNWFMERKIHGCSDASVEALTWSGSRLISSGLHGEISELDLNKLCVKQSVDSYGGAVWCLDVNTEQSLLAAGCEDGCVRLFDITDGGLEFARIFNKQEGRILSLCWHKDGQVLVAGGSDGTIRVYEVSTGHARLRITLDNFPKRNTLVWALAVTSDFTIISGDSLGKTQFWDGKYGTLIQNFSIHSADVLAVCVNKREDTVYSSGVDNKLMEFKLVTDQDGNKSWSRARSTRAHTHDIRALAWLTKKKGTRTENVLVSGGVDTNLIIYSTWAYGKAFPKKLPAFAQFSDIHISSKAGVIMYQKPTSLHFWKLGKTVDDESLRLEENPSHLLQMNVKSPHHIVCSAVSTDCKYATFSDVNHISIFTMDLETSPATVQRIKCLPEKLLPALNMTFTADNTKLISVSNEKTMQITDVVSQPVTVDTVAFPLSTSEINGTNEDPYSPVTEMAVNEDGTLCACADTSRHINVFNINEAKHHCSLPRLSRQITAMAFQPGTNVLAIVTTTKEIFMFDVDEMKMTEWSKKATENGVPRQWQDQQAKVVKILFDRRSPNIMLLHSNDMIVLVDTTKPLPSSAIRLFETKRDRFAERNARKRKHEVIAEDRKDSNSDTGGSKDEVWDYGDNEDPRKNEEPSGIEETPKTQNKDPVKPCNFRICQKYKPLLFLGMNDDNSLVTVERSWLSIMDSLPPTLHRKRYGT